MSATQSLVRTTPVRPARRLHRLLAAVVVGIAVTMALHASPASAATIT